MKETKRSYQAKYKPLLNKDLGGTERLRFALDGLWAISGKLSTEVLTIKEFSVECWPTGHSDLADGEFENQDDVSSILESWVGTSPVI